MREATHPWLRRHVAESAQDSSSEWLNEPRKSRWSLFTEDGPGQALRRGSDQRTAWSLRKTVLSPTRDTCCSIVPVNTQYSPHLAVSLPLKVWP